MGLLLPVAAALLAQTAAAARPRFPLPHFRTTNFTQMGNLPTGLGPDAGGQGGYVAPAFLSNGFHGLRLGPIPFLADPYAGTSRPSGPYPGGTPTVPAVLAGYLHRDPKGRQRVLAAAPFPFETAIRVGDTLLSNRTAHLVTVLAQSFDMRDGTLRTSLVFADRDGSAGPWSLQINVTQFASRSDPTLVAMRITTRAEPPHLNISLSPAISLGGVPGEPQNDTTPVPNWTWDSCETLSLVSDCGSRMGLTAKAQLRNGSAPGTLRYDLIASSVAGDAYSPQDPMLAAYTAMEKGLYIGGFDELAARNRAAWAELWRSRITFGGPGFTATDQQMLDTAFFCEPSPSQHKTQTRTHDTCRSDRC